MNMDGRCAAHQSVEKKKGRSTEKLNIIAGMSNGKIIAPLIYNYNTDSLFFNTWLENHLIPELQEQSVLIADNASFHKTKKTIEIVEKYGHKLIFLPSYSPDLNPIEKFWAALKAKIRMIIDDFNTLFDVSDHRGPLRSSLYPASVL